MSDQVDEGFFEFADKNQWIWDFLEKSKESLKQYEEEQKSDEESITDDEKFNQDWEEFLDFLLDQKDSDILKAEKDFAKMKADKAD